MEPLAHVSGKQAHRAMCGGVFGKDWKKWLVLTRCLPNKKCPIEGHDAEEI